MRLPKYMIAQAEPDPPAGQYWVVRTRNPFLLARVGIEGEGLVRLFPWPGEVFRGLAERKQARLVRTMADFWYHEIERIPYGRAPGDISWIVSQRNAPPPRLVADSRDETFVISLAAPRCLLPVTDERAPAFGEALWLDGGPIGEDEMLRQLVTLRAFYGQFRERSKT